MPGVRTSAPKGRVRIDRRRGKPRGYAHHAEEQRLPPPGRAERIAAHAARVEREEAELRERQLQARRMAVPEDFAGPVPVAGTVSRRARRALRQRIVAALACRGGAWTRREVAAEVGITLARCSRLTRGDWFESLKRAGKRYLTLTPEGRAEAERLVREGGNHADR